MQTVSSTVGTLSGERKIKEHNATPGSYAANKFLILNHAGSQQKSQHEKFT